MECYLLRGKCVYTMVCHHEVPPFKVVGGIVSMTFIVVLSSFPLHIQDGRTALTTASRSGRDHIVKELLRREANVNHQEEVSTQDSEGGLTFSLCSALMQYYGHCWLHCNRILCQCCTSQSKVVDCTHVCWYMYIPSYSRIAYKLDAAMAC